MNSFYIVSGQKSNIEKTRAIWMGSLNKSNTEYDKEISQSHTADQPTAS